MGRCLVPLVTSKIQTGWDPIIHIFKMGNIKDVKQPAILNTLWRNATAILGKIFTVSLKS